MVALEGIDDSREKATFTKGAGMSYSFHFGLESPVYMPYSSALPNRIGIPGLSTERMVLGQVFSWIIRTVICREGRLLSKCLLARYSLGLI